MSGQQASFGGGTAPAAAAQRAPSGTSFAVILSLSFCHLLNDLMQSLVPALYPILKTSYALDFGQIGLITLAFQWTLCRHRHNGHDAACWIMPRGLAG
ncbi:MAG: hypothetical protein K2X49_06825, partial [Acetobacteraceae bacterium]|nr:hypothetical protein [Acetobacteraceae bacterium]